MPHQCHLFNLFFQILFKGLGLLDSKAITPPAAGKEEQNMQGEVERCVNIGVI